jgi:predicted restriction endonuclease
MIDRKLHEYDLSIQELAVLLPTSLRQLTNSIEMKTELYEQAKRLLNNPVQLIEKIKLMEPRWGKRRIQHLENRINDLIYSKLNDAIPGYVFLKQVKSNELGIRNGISGQAGSFILVPKNSIGFFPELSDSIPNDNQEITVIIMPENETRKLEFVFHNSKITDNDPTGRDEYRIYNRNYIGDSILLKPEDIVLITKIADLTYKLYRVTTENSIYDNVLKLIYTHRESRAISAIVPIVELITNNINLFDFETEAAGNFSLQSELLSSVEEYVSADINIYNSILSLTQNSLMNENIDTIVRKINQIKRDYRFKRVILHAYLGNCAISELNISYGDKTNIQACHIIGKAEHGSDHPQNGIALDMNLHWAFDNGMITLTNDYRVEVHKMLIDNQHLMRYQGKKIQLPEDPSLWPSLDALEHHQTYTFGKFAKK